MNFLKLFLRGLALLPSLIQGIESIFGAKTGGQKKEAALEIVSSAINLTDAVTGKHVVDAKSFSDGLGKVIDGVVQCLNASLWAKA
ncbi:MAG: hypothetical protein JSS87_01870 [Acidobacteria bacterium]|nr:hypothetical protein [Acidobacteriota bacterium]